MRLSDRIMAQHKSNDEKKNTLKKTLVLYTMNEINGVKSIFDRIPIHLFEKSGCFSRYIQFLYDRHQKHQRPPSSPRLSPLLKL